MVRSDLRRILRSKGSSLADQLAQQQHLHPHQPLSRALDLLVKRQGICPQVIGPVTDWLKLDPQRPLGRLTRVELAQLGQCIYRYWRQSV